jgi:hypothetical protein
MTTEGAAGVVDPLCAWAAKAATAVHRKEALVSRARKANLVPEAAEPAHAVREVRSVLPVVMAETGL